MKNSINAIVVEKKDYVGVALEPLKPNDYVYFKVGNETKSIKIISGIPIYHKFALKDIAKGDIVIKYGQNIGKATQDIKAGEHVHTQNLISVREGIE